MTCDEERFCEEHGVEFYEECFVCQLDAECERRERDNLDREFGLAFGD